MSRIVVLGANGMLGGSIFRYLTADTTHDVFGTVRSMQAANQIRTQGFQNLVADIDIINHVNLSHMLKDLSPKLVINCIGLIKQENKCKDPVSAIEVNSLAPHRIAEICKSIGAKLIHFSTDCVFNGSVGNYSEHDLADAIDLYGRSKLLGEVDYDGHLTLRTSIIGHEIESNQSLINWFMSQTKPVNGFTKAIFSGFPTICIAEFLEKYVLRNSSLIGLYHLSSKPIDKYKLLDMVRRKYNLDILLRKFDEIEINRSLNSESLRNEVGFISDDWDIMIEKMYGEYNQYFK